MALYINQDLVVPKGTVRSYTANFDNGFAGAVLMGGGLQTTDNAPDLINRGEIHLNPSGEPSVAAPGGLFSFASQLGWYDARLENYGLISAIDPERHSSGVFSGSNSTPNLLNAGRILAEAKHWATIYTSSDVSFGVTNTATGFIKAKAAHAEVIRLRNGGAVRNDGKMIAESTGGGNDEIPDYATVIEWGAGGGAMFAASVFNSGLIQASGTDPATGRAIAIHYSGNGEGRIVNSGTIRGDYAIKEDSEDSQYSYLTGTILENDGLIDGEVVFGTGNDRIENRSEIIGSVELGQGTDIFDGRLGTVSGTIHGGRGSDRLTDGADNQTLFGDDGMDTLEGGPGDDRLDGGAGIDTAAYSNAPSAVTVSLSVGGAQATGGAGLDTLISIERLTGSAFGDRLEGNGSDNILLGGDGDDWLDGMAGNDGMGGGDGNDTYVVRQAGDEIRELSSDDGTDTVRSAVSFTLGERLENLVLTGTAVRGTGNDLANVLAGNAAANVLRGGAGDDTLRGGAGSDTLDGGEGGDRFVFNTTLGSGNVDRLEAFERGSDRILLDNAVFKGLAGGPLAPGAFRVGSAAADASDRIVYNPATGALLFDPDGTGAKAAVRFATLDPRPATLAASDFDVIAAGGEAAASGAASEPAATSEAPAPEPAANALRAPTLIATPSLPWISPNFYAPIRLGEDHTVPAETVLFGEDLPYIFHGNDVVYPTFVNDGTLWNWGPTTTTLYSMNFGPIVNNGLIVAHSTESDAHTVYITSAFEGLTNTGQIYALTDYLFATGVREFAAQDMINSGLIAARALGQIEGVAYTTATGVYRGNGGHLHNMATGQILAEGAAARAVYMGRGHQTPPGLPELVSLLNDGRIEARSLDPALDSVAVELWSLSVEDMIVVNSGTIRSDIAIIASGAPVPDNPGEHSITNRAEGLIDGLIYLDVFNDKLVNHGRIVGAVDMSGGSDLAINAGTMTGGVDLGEGADIWLSLGGRLNGAVDGGDGSDALFGSGGTDLLYGGTGDDVIRGGGGADRLNGGAGADTFVYAARTDSTAASFDTIAGFQSGADRIDLTALAVTSLSLQPGSGFTTLTVQTPGGSLVVRVEGSLANADIIRSASPTVAGTAGADLLHASAGGSTLTGEAGDDMLIGSNAADRLHGGTGGDTMWGGAGDDVYSADDMLDVIWELEGQGRDTVLVRYHNYYMMPANVEDVVSQTGDFTYVYGNHLANLMTGNSVINSFEGGDGDDTMLGLGGDDYLVGEGGNDWLEGGAGTDRLEGGAGDDIYIVEQAADEAQEWEAADGVDTVRSAISWTLGEHFENLILTGTASIGGTGNALDNVLTGNGGANLLRGGEGADRLIGAGGLDRLYGDAGDDRLEGGAGDDLLYGGAGNDHYLVTDAGDEASEAAAADGVDTVTSAVSFALGAHIEHLVLSGTEAIDGTGNGLANSFTGNAAANRLDGGAGADTMDGGGGNDIYVVDHALDSAVETSEAGGTDSVRSSVSFGLGANLENLVLTGAGAIDGLGNDLANLLTGNAGANRLDGGSGADTMTGGAGNDTYVVHQAGDKAIESSAAGGIDTVESAISLTLAANLENLTLTGSAANATGNALANILTGNAGANRLDGGAGADTMNGGGGNDLYLVDEAGDQAVESSAAGGIDMVESSDSFTLAAHVENLTLTGTAANGTGNGLANKLTGNAAANLLNGGGGADEMRGGAGNDAYVVDHEGDQAIETSSTGGIDQVRSAVDQVLGAHVENLVLTGSAEINGRGNDLANLLTGNGAANYLNGGGGADTMTGGGGDDRYLVADAGDQVVEAAGGGTDKVSSLISYTLGSDVEHLALVGIAAVDGTGNALGNTMSGNGASNRIAGGDGADRIRGGGSADTLSGGPGDDRLYGGTGSDSLTGGGGKDGFYFDTALGAANVDTITDFSPLSDTILLDRDIFAGLAADGPLAAGAFRSGTAALDADDRILYDAATGNLRYDPDGSGAAAAILFAKVDPGTALTSADFVGYI